MTRVPVFACRKPPSRKGGGFVRRALTGVFLLAAVCCCGLAMRAPQSPEVAPAPDTRPEAVVVDGVRFRPIGSFRVCDRTLGENPELSDADREHLPAEPDPATWRKLELSAPKTDGGTAEVTLIRGPEWLKRENPRVGGTVEISVPECGIEGRAEVLSIGPCPPLKPGKGPVVTATFRHHVSAVVDVHVEDLSEPIGCTGNHPFWSEDRQGYVRADELRTGERLRTLAGTAEVIQVVPRPDPEPVFNIEVQGEHVYLVAESGVLVHNGKVCGTGRVVNVIEHMSKIAAKYQKQVTGMKNGTAYLLNGVKFDGFKKGVLIEAKGLGYSKL